MRKLILVLALVLFVGTVAGDVVLGALHRTDMQNLDFTMALGYSNVNVNCMNQNGNINIGVIFNCSWYGSEYNFGQLGYAFGAIGGITTETSWHSDYAMVLFDNKGMMCTTSAARTFARNAGTWSTWQIENWISNNMIVLDL